jgi:uncharacterized NAD(P)/FAD-binding protein YdhS
MQDDCSIVIIGAGASGTLTAVQLLRRLNVPAKIYLVEKNKEAWHRGAAYSSRLLYEPLNVVAGKMSALEDEPDHFLKWALIHKDPALHADQYVSRRWYGDYLTHICAESMAQSPHVNVIKKDAIALEFWPGNAKSRHSIKLSNGEVIQADYAVLATGNEAPNHIFSGTEIEMLSGAYMSNPWHQHLKDLHPKEDVLILGTGLTMVDFAVSLYRQKHTGTIYCFSRNGYLPLPHQVAVPYTLRSDFFHKTLHQIFSAIRSDVKKASGHHIPWQSVMDAWRPHIATIWQSLTIEDRNLFLNRLRLFWEIHRHRMPSESHTAIQEMIDQQKLHLLRGRYLSVTMDKGNCLFTFRPKNQPNTCTIRVQRIINCTGPSAAISESSNPLFQQMFKHGFLTIDKLQLGIATCAEGEILTASGNTIPRCFSIGPLRRAHEWETTAVFDIRKQAASLAYSIAKPVNQGILSDVGATEP